MSRKSSLGISLLMTLCFGVVPTIQAEEGMYIGLDAHYLMSDIGNNATGKADFKFSAAGVRVGTYIEKQVGIEAYGLFGVGDDEDLGIDLELPSSYGLLARFESAEVDGGKIFLLLGYGASELEMQRSTASLPDRELYHDFLYGGGAEFRLGGSDSFINIQGMSYYHGDDISLRGASLGYRYQF